jgi:hypothetical protein
MEDDMSTRAIYTFYDSDDFANTYRLRSEVHVYKHHDGYPYTGGLHNGETFEGGGLVWIKDAKGFAWDLPRFEADEFAASFVKANKSVGGGVRLIGDQQPWEYASDCEYWYKITSGGEDVRVTVLSVDWGHTFPMAADGFPTTHRIEMEGPLDDLLATQRAKNREVA